MDSNTLITNFIGLLVYVLFVGSFLFNDILKLRIVALLSYVCAFIYFYNMSGSPIWLNITWNMLFFSVNFIQIFFILYQRYIFKLNNEELKIYNLLFYRYFSPYEFKKLVHAGVQKKESLGTYLTRQNQPVDDLIFILKGVVEITIDHKIIAHCIEGNFVGEISFISGNKASANAIVIEEVECIKWRHEDLNQFCTKYPNTEINLQKALGADLIAKGRPKFS